MVAEVGVAHLWDDGVKVGHPCNHFDLRYLVVRMEMAA
jgi:hypothetical protein